MPSGVTVSELSQALGVKAPEIIKFLMGLGAMKTMTQSLSDEEVELIATELKREITIKHAAEEELEPETYEDAEEDLADRPPVVTIMGHVDHGKTTLLDAIRETSVVDTEAGGITQHIGAYQVELDGRRITFLDTPGHEAFTAMRARGAKATDIAVLVVAADDGVMPQTKESISHARAAEVPIVVAVNKVDLPDANPDKVKNELASEGLQPEEWGGTTQFAEVSAREKQNLGELLEKVLLVADAELELKANPTVEASGPIVESRLDMGRGPVATMLVQRGTLNVGDAIVAGDAWGRVRALYDFHGEKLKHAGPGRSGRDRRLRQAAAGRRARSRGRERAPGAPARTGARRAPAPRAARPAREADLARRPLRARPGRRPGPQHRPQGGRGGSVEAALSELQKIEHAEVRVTVIHSAAGGITENDVMLASASNAMVVGFNVRPNQEARALAEREGVEIRTYRVIYQLTEDIEQALVGMLRPVSEEVTLGEAEVRALIRISRYGTIAGSYVTSGNLRRGASVRIIREGAIVHETTIDSLKRFKDDVREVAEGFECGIHLAGYDDVKEGDVLEVFEVREVERTDLSEVPPAPPLHLRRVLARRRRRCGLGLGFQNSQTRLTTSTHTSQIRNGTKTNDTSIVRPRGSSPRPATWV